MTNSAAQIQTLPLAETHQRLGATMVERDGWQLPWSYGDTSAEYKTVAGSGNGLIDLSSRGRIWVSGSDAIPFLNGLITNDMKTLADNSWMPAVFPNVQGRLIAKVRVARMSSAGDPKDPKFLLDTEAASHERVLKSIERFTMAGDFRVMDVTRETAQLSLQGKNARKLVESVLGELSPIANNGVAQVSWQGTDVIVFASRHTPEGGMDLIVTADHADSLWRALEQQDAQPFAHEALEVLRLEAGVPRFGIDMDETNVVTETNLDDAVSYTKGCYLGQEIIARIKYRGHVAKKLTGIVMDQPVTLEPGAVVKSTDDKEIGRITSAGQSPRIGSTIALAYIKYDYLNPDTPVRAGDVTGRVAALPFIKASDEPET